MSEWREPFKDMDQQTRTFYHRVFASAMLNIHAVRRGYFDTYLCETDDPAVSRRWLETLPKISAIIRNSEGG